MEQITIVTAFFDIGREKFQNTPYARSVEKYMQQFEFWARINNNLVVYTQPQFAERIRCIRRNFGLDEKTTIVEIEDVFAIEADLFEKMSKVEQNMQYALWGINPFALRNRATYDYVTMMKFWCLKEAAKVVDKEAVLAWIDFGFNHGGDLYTKPEEFSFTWTYKDFFEDRKIRLFTLFDPDEVLLCESLQLMYVCVMGCLVIVPQELCDELWSLAKSAMEAMVMLDAIDDDQQLLIMAYKNKRELFKICQSSWFLPLKEYGGEHLTCKKSGGEGTSKSPDSGRFKKILSRIKHLNIVNQKKDRALAKELASRIYQAAQKYYKYR